MEKARVKKEPMNISQGRGALGHRVPPRGLMVALKSSINMTRTRIRGVGFSLPLPEATVIPEDTVILKVEERPINLIVDTGAQNSVSRRTDGPIRNKNTWVERATGIKPYSWMTQRMVDLGTGRVPIHS